MGGGGSRILIALMSRAPGLASSVREFKIAPGSIQKNEPIISFRNQYELKLKYNSLSVLQKREYDILTNLNIGIFCIIITISSESFARGLYLHAIDVKQ